jgi:hypothetical protein
MNRIKYIYEPERLWLTWRNRRASVESQRLRFIVAEIIKKNDNHVVFNYLKNEESFSVAKEVGFLGYPAFNLKQDTHEQGVLDAFLRRLPPRKRKDFPLYLNQYGLPENFNGSDFALLAYTGAKLASDTFEICPDLSTASAPLDLFVEVSGFRHYLENAPDIKVGDPVNFLPEPENLYDSKAIAITFSGKIIGYVNRALCSSFLRLVKEGRVNSYVARVGGTFEDPQVYVMAEYR